GDYETDIWGAKAVFTSGPRVINSTMGPVEASGHKGTARGAAGFNGIVLDTGASPTDGAYIGQLITIVSGRGAGQTRIISAYNGTSKNATVSSSWLTTPDTTSVFVIAPLNNTLAADGTRLANTFDIYFDRLLDPTTFDKT